MRLSADLKAFQGRIGHEFRRPDLLLRAVTHSSLASSTRPSNERLEFLGDRVLGLTIAEALLAADRDAVEGQLAPRLNGLVRQETCAETAREIGLGDVLKLGRSEMMTGGRRKEALLCDAIEAVIAAVYLDAGFETARDLVLRLWGGRVAAARSQRRDAKSLLQEWVQSRGFPPPSYQETARSGPDHAPIFTVEVRIESGEVAVGVAAGKRQAEQVAARELLTRLEVEDGDA